MSFRSRAFALLGVGGLSLSLFTGTAPSASASPSWCLPTGALDVSSLPAIIDPALCSLTGRVVATGAMAVVVPEPGQGIGAFGVPTHDSAVHSLVVMVLDNGTVEINPPATTTNASLNPVIDADFYTPPAAGASDDNLNGAALDTPDASLTAGTAAGSPNKCTDRGVAYNAGYPRWAVVPTWFYNQGGQPTSYPASSFVSATQAAQVNVSRGDNSCGWAVDPKIYAKYGGGTTTALQISSTSTTNTCGTQDSKSVIGWGALAGGYIGWTCMRWDASYRMMAGDIRMANNTLWSIGSLTGCINKWDYESLATHEFGHWYGLQHVAESTHGNLVMSPQINGKCQANERNLGYGDIYGMLALYGKN